LLWKNLWLGNLTGTNISLHPGTNLLELVGVLDPLRSLRDVGFFEMVKNLKILNELRSYIQSASEPPMMFVVGTGCSVPLYASAIQTINQTFPLTILPGEIIKSLEKKL